MARGDIGIKPNAAKKLLQQSYKSIEKKVKEGKTLTRDERNFLLASAGGGQPSDSWVKNQTVLAEALGVDRKTIQRWNRANPELKKPPYKSSNGFYGVNAWRAFKEKREEEKTSAAEGPTASQLRAQQTLLKNEKLELELKILKKEFVPVSDVEKWGTDLGNDIRRAVLQIHQIAPQVVGLSVADAESRLKEVEKEILTELHLLANRIDDVKSASEVL